MQDYTRYLYYAIICILFALCSDRSGRSQEERDQRRGYRLVTKDKEEYPKEERPRYQYAFRPTYLPLIFAIVLIVTILRFGLQGAQRYLTGDTVNIFVLLALYYAGLLILSPRLRSAVRPSGCADLWILPNILYLAYYQFWRRNAPVRVITVPKTPLKIAFYVWLVGFLVCLAYTVVSHLRFRRQLLATAQPCTDERILEKYKELKKFYCGTKWDYPLLVSPVLNSPLSIGMLRRSTRIVLPDQEYTSDDLDLIFRHELIHICRNDAAVKFFLSFCTALCWFNPLMHLAMKCCSEDIELSCDELVLKDAGEDERQHYAALILSSAGESRGFTTCLAASMQSMKYRLTEILEQKGKEMSGAFLIAILCFLLLASYGGVSLAYEAGSVKDAMLDGSVESAFVLDDEYAWEMTGKNSMTNLAMHAKDKEGIMEYLSGLSCEELLTSYRLNQTGRYLQLNYSAGGKSYRIQLGEHYASIYSYGSLVQKGFYLNEPVDIDYVLSLF